ncbi:21_t:CDS:2, partial [Scutellospora calospora]
EDAKTKTTFTSCIMKRIINIEKNNNNLPFVFGKCAQCNRSNISPTWCQKCEPKLIYKDLIIPFDRFSDIKQIGKSRFSCVFSATWLDGTRKIIGSIMFGFKRICNKSSIVALKSLHSSNNLEYLQEFKNHMECRLN